MAHTTEWTWQNSMSPGQIRCELDGQFFRVKVGPPVVSSDGALAVYLHERHVALEGDPVHTLTVHGRRFAVEAQPDMRPQWGDDVDKALETILGVRAVEHTRWEGVQVVTTLYFIVDAPEPRVFRVRHEEVTGPRLFEER